MVFRGDGNVRVAKSLLTLFDQVEEAFPGRAKGNDGTIGDANHQQTNSDHNPTPEGVICALDITHDPRHGFDAGIFAETLRLNRDQRIKYVIFNGRIFSSTTSPWIWRDRNKGEGDHTEHVHISVGRGPDGHSTNPELYDNTLPWAIMALPGTIPAQPKTSTKRFTDIKATVFNDAELAYGPKPADFMGYSLPGRIKGELPLRITNRVTGLSAIANKCDIGPWYAEGVRGGEDRWWENGTRPRAETDPQTNGAGIDLYPALARAIGVQIVERGGRIVAGEAQVDVEILSEAPPMAESSNTDKLIISLIERIDALTRFLAGVKEEPVEPPKPPPPPPPPAQTSPMAPLDFRTLILSALAAVVAPATGISETVDKGTLGSLLPYAGMAASALGVPAWILPVAGRFIGGLFSQTGAQK